jgi:hypothetical protein
MGAPMDFPVIVNECQVLALLLRVACLRVEWTDVALCASTSRLNAQTFPLQMGLLKIARYKNSRRATMLSTVLTACSTPQRANS